MTQATLAFSNDHQEPLFLSSIVSFLSLVLLIGGSILVTLTYVGWRKFKATKMNKQRKKRNSNY